MAQHSTEQAFKKSIDSLDQVFAFVASCLEHSKAGSAVAYAVNIAVEEFFTNMVKYNPENRHDIMITITNNDGRLTVSLLDRDVEPFDVTVSPDLDTTLPLQQRKVGGLGIQIARELVDSIHYEYKDRCSTITFTKKLEH